MWAHPPWRDRYGFASGRELAWYGDRFTTVEGNTTFYAVPKPETIERWAEQAPPSLRFCFKLPRHITHERRLRNTDEALEEFLTRLVPLSTRLGPLQVQLPASFEPVDLAILLEFLDRAIDRAPSVLGAGVHWAVEVRHPEFSPGGSDERRLNDALAARGVNRVILDSRALFATEPTTREEREAWQAKPRLPVRPVATATEPLVRLIGQSDSSASLEHWRSWFPKLAEWIGAGATPHVFVHTPDNVAAPELAIRVWNEIAELVPLPHLPELPPHEPNPTLDL